MAKFFVGQRVKFCGVWAGNGPNPNGKEGVIIQGPGKYIGRDTGRTYEWQVNTTDGFELVANSSDLIPLTDANDKISWDECIWKPDHMKEVPGHG